MGLLKETLLKVFVGKSGRDALRAYQDAQSLPTGGYNAAQGDANKASDPATRTAGANAYGATTRPGGGPATRNLAEENMGAAERLRPATGNVDLAARQAQQAQKSRRISDRAAALEAEGMNFEEARAEALAQTLTEGDNSASEILAALQAADSKLGREKSRMVDAAAKPERAKLINEALAAMRAKKSDLDALDPELRMKLTIMALGAFGPPPDRPGN